MLLVSTDNQLVSQDTPKMYFRHQVSDFECSLDLKSATCFIFKTKAVQAICQLGVEKLVV